MDERNFLYMFYGFAVAWLIVIAYVVFIATREKKLREEIDRVKAMIADRERKS
ncbi:MAG: CcmD family protein [Bryobacteraceae bacterium]|nr:CcmD family protein [Bryobacteraceae bacterium]